MDDQKEHNGWLTFREHWGILVTVLLIGALAAALLPLFNSFRTSHKTVKVSESDDAYGDLASDAGSVYWNVLCGPATNRIQFVLLLPVTTTIGSGSTNYPAYACDYCNLQIKSNRHRWRIEDNLDWNAGVQAVQLRDLTANTTGTLNLDDGRFWLLDEKGRATRIENIDSTTMNKIFSQVKAYQTNGVVQANTE